MNARHLFRYARYALAALACVGFGGALAPTEFGLGRDAAAASLRQQNRSGQAAQSARSTLPGGKTMNARHLFRYARYALAALASVGFGLGNN